jgi:acyl-lipid omega-6 desaturase (Delta-12 desaturase)
MNIESSDFDIGGSRRQRLDLAASPSFERDDFRALSVYAAQLIAYLASIALALSPVGLFINLLGSLSAGFQASTLINMGHDACHQSLTGNRRLNDWLGRLAFVPSARAASLWIQEHNQNHHGFTNVMGRDHVWAPLSPQQYMASSLWRRALYRFYRGPAGILIYGFIEEWLLRTFLPVLPEFREKWQKHLFDSCFMLASQLVLMTLIVTVSKFMDPARPVWLALVLGWLMPVFWANAILSLVSYLHHTHPTIPWFQEGDRVDRQAIQLFGTTRTLLPQPLDYFSNSIMEHNAHHLYPKVPFYALFSIQRRLEESFSGLIACRVTWRDYLERVRACKLYDLSEARWVDFGGRPTGPTLQDHPATGTG